MYHFYYWSAVTASPACSFFEMLRLYTVYDSCDIKKSFRFDTTFQLTLSERELTFTFAIMLSPVRRLSSVCNVRVPYSDGWNFPQFLYAVWYLCNRLVPWPSIDIRRKFYEDRPRGTTPSGGVKRKRGS